MGFPLWDASALAKRYAPEAGSQTVDALFRAVPAAHMIATFMGYAEIYSLLMRKINARRIESSAFREAVSSLQAEVLLSPEFHLLSVDDNGILASIALIQRHNLNASDAAILAAFLRFQAIQWQSPGRLVASDHRLLRAASAEGLDTIDPETVGPEQAIAIVTKS